MSTETTTSAGNKHNKSLKIVFTITLIYFIIEVIVGFMSNSLALLSDAAHMLTDVAGQALALFAIWMASKLRNSKKTYGYLRTEIFSALINAIVLIFISGYILYEAWQRFQDPPKVAGFSMLIVASIGLIINLISMKILKSGSEESINIKGAFLEVVADMLSSIAVIIAGIIILSTGWLLIDPIISALIGLFILPRTFGLLKESVDILLEGVPKDVNYDAVEKYISKNPGVDSIHDLHIWSLTSGVNALSGHIIMKPETTITEMNDIIFKIKKELNSSYKISHTTLEVHINKEDYTSNSI
ncbi:MULTISPECIES: cation diffusion facilitator family transporter [Flavobacterium]|jgi:cobalt-zinc-cadmium efflux system protein|uniref:cation diffusion facilitator family transporter n=1 Tax=Flavobacterium TaxID=237 RepID=UPI001B55091C|nr:MULTISPECIES: cation diffusion facilitator family transporter [Flavobacterium]MBP7318365.1 cation transporter [Flavobacterium sp.]MBP9600854.1 cation transporter [Lutibacter sp.]HRL72021.1 cation diffusion facilitator family transporter [Flavobacterium sp.]